MNHAPTVVPSDPDILDGALVFTGTRVPVQALIDYLVGGQPLTDFLEDFPTVSREQAIATLQLASRMLMTNSCSAG